MFSSPRSFVPTPMIRPLQHHASSAPVSHLNGKQWRQARQTNSVWLQTTEEQQEPLRGREALKMCFEVWYLLRRTYCLLWFYFYFDKSQIEFSNITASCRHYFTFGTNFTIWVQNSKCIPWTIAFSSPLLPCFYINVLLFRDVTIWNHISSYQDCFLCMSACVQGTAAAAFLSNEQFFVSMILYNITNQQSHKTRITIDSAYLFSSKV